MNIKTNNEFIINKNLVSYPLTPDGIQCIDYCQHQNSLNRLSEYVNDKDKINNSLCYYVGKLTGRDGKKINNHEKMLVNFKLGECDYKNINYNFTNSPLEPWANIINTYGFVHYIYNIYDYDGYINFISDQNIPLLTKLRVSNAYYQIQMKLFLISDAIVEFYMQLIKQIWINDLYDYFYNYIFIEIINAEQKIYIKKSDQEKKYYKKEKINYFISKFANRSRIYDYVSKYNEYYSDRLMQMKDEPIRLISQKQYYFDYIKNKIDNIVSFSKK